MSASSTVPAPGLCRIAIDDVGEFLLLVVAGERSDLGGPFQGCTIGLESRFQAGPVWWAQVGRGPKVPLGSNEPGLGAPFAGALQRPAAASACAVLRKPGIQGFLEEGLLLLPMGVEGRTSFGPSRLGWRIDEILHSFEIWPEPEGLQLVCSGGIRVAKASGGFEDALPRRILPWPSDGAVQARCQVRSGAPLFVTLEPWEEPKGASSTSARPGVR